MVGLEFIFHNRTPNKKRRAGRASSWWPRVTLSLRKSPRGARCAGARDPRWGRGLGSPPGPHTGHRAAPPPRHCPGAGGTKGPHPPPTHRLREGARFTQLGRNKGARLSRRPARRARGQTGGAGREPRSGAQVEHCLNWAPATRSGTRGPRRVTWAGNSGFAGRLPRVLGEAPGLGCDRGGGVACGAWDPLGTEKERKNRGLWNAS